MLMYLVSIRSRYKVEVEWIDTNVQIVECARIAIFKLLATLRCRALSLADLIKKQTKGVPFTLSQVHLMIIYI